MLTRVLAASFGRQKRRKMVAFAAVALGTAAASALLDVALGVGDQVNRELKAFGANLAVYPAGAGRSVVLAGVDVTGLRAPAYLDEADVRRAKENFWINNILGLAPVLDVTAAAGGREVLLRGTWFDRELELPDGEPFTAGIRDVLPYWQVEGRWPAAGDEVLVGVSLAGRLGLRPGDALELRREGRPRTFRVAGILRAGGEEDGAVIADLDAVQALASLPGRVGRILVSALTTPEDAAAARLGMDPSRLSLEAFEAWSCTPFVSSIAYELKKAVPGSEVRPIRRVADAEGRVLDRISGLMALLASMAALAAALTVTSSLTTGVLERRGEIGLLKAMGATNRQVVGMFLLEAALLGALGGLAGAAVGAGLARLVGIAVFGAPVALSPFAFPLAVAGAVVITLLGSTLPARRITGFRPAEVLHGL
ncbi:MAG: ABC transporter permease [Acidobacteriota bacterium]